MLYHRFDDGSTEPLIVLFGDISRSAEHDSLSQYDYGGGLQDEQLVSATATNPGGVIPFRSMSVHGRGRRGGWALWGVP